MRGELHIKTYFQMLTQILRKESDWDLMYYLESYLLDNPERTYVFVQKLVEDLRTMSYDELNKGMNKCNFTTKESIIGTFIKIIEKQRGYPLWMWEYSDIEDGAKARADDNGYGYLFIDED